LSKRVLLVAYPLLPVSEASAGGAEQILWTLDRELVRRGWKTEVAACAGSEVSGELIVTGAAPGGRSQSRNQSRDQSQLPHIRQQRADVGHPGADDVGHPEDCLINFEEREREHAERVVEACASGRFQIVLDHSGHFFRHAGRVEATVLATLHLPRELYAVDAFDGVAENVFFNCVSDSQRSTFMDLPRLLGAVRNGIDVERFPMSGQKSDYLLWLGRVCPEKAPHLAVAAAQKAGLQIVVAGQVYPFLWHEEYWEREVKPLIDGDRVRWVELPSFAEKTKLLREARALLVTSRIAETTSLVALEAMASGTPVIAFNAGALRDVVPEGTGFIVESVEEMARACKAVSQIRALSCREWVAKQYSVEAMADGYEALIGDLVKEEVRLRQA
jgi:glycosyltransferase involved in cell wall biosynthesis